MPPLNAEIIYASISELTLIGFVPFKVYFWVGSTQCRIFELYSLRKKGKDLSKLTIGELDEMSFKMSSTWFKID